MALAAAMTIDLSAVLTSALDFATSTSALSYARRIGITENNVNMMWHDQRTLTASATEDLDLAGSLTMPLGGTLTFARLNGCVVYAATTNTNSVIVSRPAANGVALFAAASDAISLPPGGLFAWCDPGLTGAVVSAGTSDLITLTNSAGGTSVVYDVFLFGEV